MEKWITNDVHQIVKILGGRSNSFLISNGNKFLLVDTGRKNRRRSLIKRIDQYRANGLVPAGLILTHTHFDHAENAAFLKERYGIPIIVHKSEAAYLKNGVNPPIKGSVLITKHLTDLFQDKISPLNKYQTANYDYLVEDKLDLSFMGFNVYVIHTLGHTIGSMSVIVDNDIAIVGDAMFGVFKGSVFPPFAADSTQLVNSWGKLLETGCRTFLPGHGTSDSRELLEKEYQKYKERYGLCINS